MKLRIFCLIFSIFTWSLLFSQEALKITWDYRDLTFGEFIEKAESTLHLRFFYKEEWVRDLKPGNYPGANTLPELLDNLFRERSIFYFIDESGNVIITKNFAVKVSKAPSSADKNFIAPTELYESQEQQKLSGNIFIDIGNPADRNKPGNVSISGYITNRDTREPVAGVTVFVQKLSIGAISNQYGFYNLNLPRGVHLIRFSFIGMKEKQVNVNLYGSGELNMEMNSMLIPLKETVVSADKNVIFQRYEVGVEKVNISSFKLLPTAMGESDIIKSVLLIPGVQSVGEGSAGFSVRGGSSDQNLILLYGAPVYNTAHLFGFFSAVNSDIIRDVTLYKGGIPSRYGGRISSVLDITSKEGNRKEFAGNAGISPITTHVMVEGPIIKDTLTYSLAGRTTYSNYLLRLVDDPEIVKSEASFYDLNGKITYDINKNNKLDLSSYLSHDSFKFNSDTVYSYNNAIIALRWRHFFNSRFFSQFSVNNSNYKYRISSEGNPQEGFVMTHKVNSTGLKADFNMYQGRNEINYGAEFTGYSILPGSYQPSNDSSLVVPKKIEAERAVEAGVYFDDKFIVNDYFSVNAGMRLSSFFDFGPKTYFLYDPNFSKSSSTITDTVTVGSGEIYKSYFGPEFRVSLNFKTSAKSSFKVNYNRTRQYLHLLSNTTSISPTDTWKLSDYYIKPQIGDQYAAGFYQMLFNGSIQSSLEVYYKSIKNMLDYKGGTNLIMADNVEQDVVDVKGKAYGIELSLRKDIGRIQWSLAYTYSRTFLKSTGTFSDEIINGGNWFPANYDKPHDLVATFNFLFSRRFSFSGNYLWSTGRPITYPVATYYMGDNLLIHYSDRNKYRIPDYMRFDISFTLSGNLKSHKIANPHWVFSVYNLFGRENVYSVYFQNENKVLNGYKLSIFARAIPSISFNFDF